MTATAEQDTFVGGLRRFFENGDAGYFLGEASGGAGVPWPTRVMAGAGVGALCGVAIASISGGSVAIAAGICAVTTLAHGILKELGTTIANYFDLGHDFRLQVGVAISVLTSVSQIMALTSTGVIGMLGAQILGCIYAWDIAVHSERRCL